MKKLIYTVLICFLILNVSNAQRLITTVKTPKWVTVPDTYDKSLPPLSLMSNDSKKTDMSINEIDAIQKYAEITYDATFISAPSVLYNCHSFAWNMSEQGIICWMGYETTTAEDIYWHTSDGGYMEVSTEAEASKVSYSKDNHSAVTTHTLGIVRSKWGDGPLYEHRIGDGPYIGMDSRKYYKLRVEIAEEDNDIPCYYQTKTFTSPSLNLVGATYTWSCSGNLETFSGQGTNTYTVRVNSTSGQLSWVQLDITHQNFSGDNTDISKTSSSTRKEFWVGPPVISNVSGPRYNPPGASAIYSATVEGITPASTYSWSLMPGTFNNYFNPGGLNCYVTWYRAGEYVLKVSASNQCPGTSSPYYYPVTVGGYLLLSPNPTTDNVQVTVLQSQSVSEDVLVNPTVTTESTSEKKATYNVSVLNTFGTVFYSSKKRKVCLQFRSTI